MSEGDTITLKTICVSTWDKYKWWVIGGIILILVLLVIYFASVRPNGDTLPTTSEQLILTDYRKPPTRVQRKIPREFTSSYDVEYVQSTPDQPRPKRKQRKFETEKPSFEPSKKRQYKGEEACARAIEEIFGVPFPSVRPNWLKNPKTGRNMEIDCYNEDLKIGVEYHGRQHYERVNHFHKTEEDYENQIYRDNLKLDLCDANGVYLITVPHTVPLNEIKEYITRYLPHNRQKRLDEGLTV